LLRNCQQITPHYDAPIQKKELKKARDNNVDATTTASNIACEIGSIGFKEKASHRLVDVPFCHIATPAINDALRRIREEKREEARRGSLKKPGKGATLLLRDSNGVVETNHTAYVNATVKGFVFKFQAGNFFQNNPYMLDLMVDLVVDAATKASPTTGGAMTHLIDCYCGSGLFCIGSSSHFDVCVGIEVNEIAISEARENAASNGIRNCDFVAASAEAIFSSEVPVGVGGATDDGGEEEEEEEEEEDDDDEKKRGGLLVGDFPRDTTVVVVDPPRKGCSVEFLDQLNEYRPARVVYMSCDPATQARDAKLLLSFGYRISSIQPFDLFPQTRHIECLAVFERMVDVDGKLMVE
jgi:23S rRNA (uracil1939-C5)-methyltransferase/tRNA (uracil-5-)-methyltransferase